MEWINSQWLLTAVFTIGGSWAVSKWRLDKYEKDFEEHKKDVWREMTKLREWRHSHEKDSADTRVDYERRFGDVATEIAKNAAQYTELTKRVDAVDTKLDKIDGKIDRLIGDR